MAGAHVQTKDAQVGSGATVTVSLTSVVAGNHLCASTEAFNPVATSMTLVTSTSPAATWANILAPVNQTGGGLGSAQQGLRVDYSENVASGSWAVIHHAASSSSITGNVTESSGVLTTGSAGTANSSGSSGASNVASQAAGSVTPTAGSILICAWVSASGNTAAPSANNSFVLRSDSTAYNGAVGERAAQFTLDNAANSAVNVTVSESSGSVQMISAVVEFLAAGGGAPAAPVGIDVRAMEYVQGAQMLQAVTQAANW